MNCHKNPIKIYLSQGDIFKNITQILKFNINEKDEIDLEEVDWESIVILTQACDLEQDYNSRNNINSNEDKIMQSVLVCPMHSASKVKEGEHLSIIGLKRSNMSTEKQLWKTISSNQHPRFHIIKKNEEEDILQDLIVDFKHYFTIPIEELYQAIEDKKYITSLADLFREDLSHRFASYLSRVGLPSKNIKTI